MISAKSEKILTYAVKSYDKNADNLYSSLIISSLVMMCLSVYMRLELHSILAPLAFLFAALSIATAIASCFSAAKALTCLINYLSDPDIDEGKPLKVERWNVATQWLLCNAFVYLIASTVALFISVL